MKISRIRDVVAPNRAHKTDAGIDMYMPKFTDRFKRDLRDKNIKASYMIDELDGVGRLLLRANENILIPSGIKMKVPDGYAFIIFNKSGIASKQGLLVGACVVDQDYQGEVHINLMNPTNTNAYILEGQKVVQGILLKMNYENVEEVDLEDLYEEKTERGEGGFGHTDNK